MAKFLVSSGSARPAASQTAMRRKPVAEAALRGLQDVFALLPVAGAEFVGLQGVEHAQHFLRVAADAEVVHRHEADDALRVDDEGGAQRDALGLVEHAEVLAQLTLDVDRKSTRLNSSH